MIIPESVRVFLLEKRPKLIAVSRRLASRGIGTMLVGRDADDGAAYTGCDQDDDVLEITEPSFDWSGIVTFAKQNGIEFNVLCGDGFRGIRLDHCSGQLPPHLNFGVAG